MSTFVDGTLPIDLFVRNEKTTIMSSFFAQQVVKPSMLCYATCLRQAHMVRVEHLFYSHGRRVVDSLLPSKRRAIANVEAMIVDYGDLDAFELHEGDIVCGVIVPYESSTYSSDHFNANVEQAIHLSFDMSLLNDSIILERLHKLGRVSNATKNKIYRSVVDMDDSDDDENDNHSDTDNDNDNNNSRNHDAKPTIEPSANLIAYLTQFHANDPFYFHRRCRELHIDEHRSNRSGRRVGQVLNYLKQRDRQNSMYAVRCVELGIEKFKQYKLELSEAANEGEQISLRLRQSQEMKSRSTKIMSYFNEALTYESKCVDAYVAKGALYTLDDNLPAAQRSFQSALDIDPNHRNAARYLEMVVQRLKEASELRRLENEKEQTFWDTVNKRIPAYPARAEEQDNPNNSGHKLDMQQIAAQLKSESSSHKKRKKKSKSEKHHRKERRRE